MMDRIYQFVIWLKMWLGDKLSWMGSNDNTIVVPAEPVIPTSVPAPAAPLPPVPPVQPVPVAEYLWDTAPHAYHSVRVICDEEGLSVDEKNLICACIYQESRFLNTAVGKNKGSTDWGLVQVNDFWHIGPGKTFPSVDYVIANPEKCVRWMITLFLQGQLNLWSSYKFGAYKLWLVPTSPMWKLKQV